MDEQIAAGPIDGEVTQERLDEAEKLRGEITCESPTESDFLANFLSFGLIIFCTLLKL